MGGNSAGTSAQRAMPSLEHARRLPDLAATEQRAAEAQVRVGQAERVVGLRAQRRTALLGERDRLRELAQLGEAPREVLAESTEAMPARPNVSWASSPWSRA